MSCPQQGIGTRWFLRFPPAQTIQWFCYYIILSLTHPSQHSKAPEESGRSLPIGCSQCLHLQLHVFFNLHFSVQVFESLTLRCEDWLEKTHCPCCGLMTVCPQHNTQNSVSQRNAVTLSLYRRKYAPRITKISRAWDSLHPISSPSGCSQIQ